LANRNRPQHGERKCIMPVELTFGEAEKAVLELKSY